MKKKTRNKPKAANTVDMGYYLDVKIEMLKYIEIGRLWKVTIYIF